MWPIINAIVASAEQTFSREQVDQMSTFAVGNASSECSASMAALPDLPVAMNRIVTCLDFVDACLVVSSFSSFYALSTTSYIFGVVSGKN